MRPSTGSVTSNVFRKKQAPSSFPLATASADQIHCASTGLGRRTFGRGSLRAVRGGWPRWAPPRGLLPRRGACATAAAASKPATAHNIKAERTMRMAI
jgi:hypothetical protein